MLEYHSWCVILIIITSLHINGTPDLIYLSSTWPNVINIVLPINICIDFSFSFMYTLCAKLSGAVYCNRSCLWVCLCVSVCLLVFCHDNSKLCASILTKLGLWVKAVTIGSWLNFGRPAPRVGGLQRGEKFLAPPYYSQRTVFASLWALFHYFCYYPNLPVIILIYCHENGILKKWLMDILALEAQQ